MSRLTFALFAILVIFSTCQSSAEARCRENQVWNSCGTSCPPTCKNPHPEVCTMQCVAGCECTGNLVKNDAGDCIPLSKC